MFVFSAKDIFSLYISWLGFEQRYFVEIKNRKEIIVQTWRFSYLHINNSSLKSSLCPDIDGDLMCAFFLKGKYCSSQL